MPDRCSICGREVKDNWRVLNNLAQPYCPDCYREEWTQGGEKTDDYDWVKAFVLKHAKCDLVKKHRGIMPL